MHKNDKDLKDVCRNPGLMFYCPWLDSLYPYAARCWDRSRIVRAFGVSMHRAEAGTTNILVILHCVAGMIHYVVYIRHVMFWSTSILLDRLGELISWA